MFPLTVFCQVIQNLSYSTSLLIKYSSFFLIFPWVSWWNSSLTHFWPHRRCRCSIFRILWDVKSQWCSDFSDFFRPSCLLYSYLNGMKCIIWLVLFSRCGMLVFITQYDEKVTYLDFFHYHWKGTDITPVVSKILCMKNGSTQTSSV